MAGSLNKVQLIGHLGRDPEVKSFNNGGRLANLRLATSKSWRDKNTGERRDATEWHTVVVHAEYAVDFADKYLRKGSLVYIEGELRTRKWQDRDGNDRYATEVVVPQYGGALTDLTGREDRGDGGGRSGGGASRQRDDGPGDHVDGGDGGGGRRQTRDDLDDEIPF